MTRLPEGKTRLDLVRQGLTDGGLKKRGRLIVSLSKLIEDPHNERKTFRNMEGLIASIKAVGLIEPITVTPAGEETYQIITGHRRYRAAKAAGLAQVEILIREPEDERLARYHMSSAGDLHAELTLVAGQSRGVILETGQPEEAHAVRVSEVWQLFDETVRFWRSWLAHSTYSGRWRETLQRSAIMLGQIEGTLIGIIDLHDEAVSTAGAETQL
jgi:hypothetical protein